MTINVNMKDRIGRDIEIGDMVELFDWGKQEKSLGIVEVTWDVDEGRVTCFPPLVNDAYDFWTKALPRCRKTGMTTR